MKLTKLILRRGLGTFLGSSCESSSLIICHISVPSPAAAQGLSLFLWWQAVFLLLLITERGPTICVMADCMPRGVPYNMLQERILGSDHSSAFLVGHAEVGYQLLGVNYYSTTPPAVSFVEIVKLTVKLIQQLTTHLKLDLAASGVAIHYPNIFPDTWRMVTRYLRISDVEHVLDGMCAIVRTAWLQTQ